MFKSISLLFIGCGFLAAQCSYTSTVNRVGVSISFDNTPLKCNSWQFSYMSSGFTSIILQLEATPDVGTIGFSPVLTQSNPSTILSGSYSFINFTPGAFRVNLIYAKGAGSIFFTLTGTGGGTGGGSGINPNFQNITSGVNINQALTISAGSVLSAINGGQIYATNLSRMAFNQLPPPANAQWQQTFLIDHLYDNSCLITSLLCFSNGFGWFQVVGPPGGGGGGGGGGSGTVGNGGTGQFAFYTTSGTSVAGHTFTIGDVPTGYPYSNLSGTSTGITPGNYGSATNCPYMTVAADGRITAISQSTSCPGGGGGGGAATSITGGLLSAIPATCATKDVYFATDQPANQQTYTCSATNTFTQGGNLGGSGALVMTNGSLDINLAVVARLTNSATVSGVYTFTNPVVSSQSTPSTSTDTCNAGAIWSDGTYIYLCSATNVIKRVAPSSF